MLNLDGGHLKSREFWVICKVVWVMSQMGISTIFQGHWQSPSTTLTAGNLPAIRAAEGDCERVYGSKGLTMIVD